MNLSPLETRRHSPFTRWLRTGVWLAEQQADPTLEVKFNPNHDPTNGQFTFASGGSGGSSARERPAPEIGRRSADPKDPANHTIHTVKAGDTLTNIAASRTGLTSADLQWLNGMADDRLQIGQKIKVPNQDFLDAGKRDFDRYVALEAFRQSHGGKLPPDPAHPPSLVQQMYGEGSKTVAKNGYTFNLDPAARTRNLYGELSYGQTAFRSKTNQAAAGGADRLHDDDGGHFIAARFNGPSDAFNHFAQNANFNRGTYRAVEDGWANDLRAGKHVSVAITAAYPDTSRRPSALTVNWVVNGRKHVRKFNNAPEGK